jgi:hypothetical protein
MNIAISIIKALLSKSTYEKMNINPTEFITSPDKNFWTVEYFHNDPTLSRKVDAKLMSTDCLLQQVINTAHNPTISEEQKIHRLNIICTEIDSRIL